MLRSVERGLYDTYEWKNVFKNIGLSLFSWVLIIIALVAVARAYLDEVYFPKFRFRKFKAPKVPKWL